MASNSNCRPSFVTGQPSSFSYNLCSVALEYVADYTRRLWTDNQTIYFLILAVLIAAPSTLYAYTYSLRKRR